MKNDGNTLPLTKEGQKTVVLVPYDDETIPMDYAVRKLAQDGKLPEGDPTALDQEIRKVKIQITAG